MRRRISVLLAAVFLFGMVPFAQALDITLTWDPSPDAVDGYKVYYRTGTPGPPYGGTGVVEGSSPLDVGNVTTADITGLDDTKTYYFTVTAYVGTVESGYSNEVSTGTGTGGGGTTPDTTAPVVSGVNPVNGATGVPLDAAISILFSEAIDPNSVSASQFAFTCDGQNVAFSVSTSSATITLAHSGMPGSVPCDLSVFAGVTDLAGNPLAANYSWSFTTSADTGGGGGGTTPDTTAPVVSGVNPVNGVTGAPLDSAISIVFSEAIDPTSLSPSQFGFICNGQAVPFSVSASSTTVTLTHGGMPGSAACDLTVYAGITDLAGNPLASDYTWSFTTTADTGGGSGGGSGGGGSGTVNQPPTIPELLGASQGYSGGGAVLFWRPSTDPDGGTVTYHVAYGTDSTLTGADTTVLEVDSSGRVVAYLAGVAPLLSGFGLFGLVLPADKRRRNRYLLGLLALVGLLLLCQCGGGAGTASTSGGGSGSGGQGGTSQSLSVRVTGLQSGATYYWQVTAIDPDGAEADSDIQNFVAQ